MKGILILFGTILVLGYTICVSIGYDPFKKNLRIEDSVGGVLNDTLRLNASEIPFDSAAYFLPARKYDTTYIKHEK